MERLVGNRKKSGINGNALRTWGFVFLAAGVIGRGVIQAHMLGIRQASAQQLLQVLGASPNNMALATLSIVLQAMETCAVPIFSLMLVEGMTHTSDLKAYFLRVAGLALASEIPYNLALSAKLMDFGSRNPVFGVLLCMVMLYFYSRYAEKKITNSLLRILLAFVTILWCQMLKVDHGAAMVLITAVLWAFRGNTLYRNFSGAAAAMVCTAFSPFFLAAPMGFLAVHSYDGEKSTNSRRVNYLAYPGILLLGVAFGVLL